jgi:hypothetical protein
MASNRKKRNLITTLSNGTTVATNQSGKQRLVFDQYQKHLGTYSQRLHHLNLAELGWQSQQLHHLDLPFLDSEVEATIKGMHKGKVPGPNGYIGIFFKECWILIKDDILAIIN